MLDVVQLFRRREIDKPRLSTQSTALIIILYS